MNQSLQNPGREAIIKEVSQDTSISLIVPTNLTNPDPIVLALKNHFKSKDLRISYERDRMPSTKPGYFNTSITLKSLDRSLLIIDTFIKAVRVRNHQILIAGEKTYVKINDEKVEIRFWEKCRSEKIKKGSYDGRELIPTGLLYIQVIDIWLRKEWGDTPYSLLEEKLARVIGGIEFFAEENAKKTIERNILKKRNEEEERLKKEIKQKKDDEQKRFSELLQESKRWAESQQLRAYLNSIESSGSLKEDLSTWLEWARSKADWLDPMIKKEDKWMEGFNHEK